MANFAQPQKKLKERANKFRERNGLTIFRERQREKKKMMERKKKRQMYKKNEVGEKKKFMIKLNKKLPSHDIV